MSSTEALRTLVELRDKHFDAKLVDEFMKMVGLYPPGSIVQLVNRSVCVVLAKNHRYQHLPRVLLVRDQNQQATEEKVLNLAAINKETLGKDHLIEHSLPDGSFGIRIKDYIDKGLNLSR